MPRRAGRARGHEAPASYHGGARLAQPRHLASLVPQEACHTHRDALSRVLLPTARFLTASLLGAVLFSFCGAAAGAVWNVAVTTCVVCLSAMCVSVCWAHIPRPRPTVERTEPGPCRKRTDDRTGHRHMCYRILCQANATETRRFCVRDVRTASSRSRGRGSSTRTLGFRLTGEDDGRF